MNQAEKDFIESLQKAEDVVENLVVKDILIENGLITHSGYHKKVIEKTKELSEAEEWRIPKVIANEIIKRNKSRAEIE
ncbi:hypothetical protein NSR02_07135 [Bacillus sp. FSL W8-1122]